MRDLPITIDLPPSLAPEVAAWVEGDAGWQVVSADSPLRPVLRLTAEPTPGGVLVVAGKPTAAQVRHGLQAGAIDVIGWPEERARLLDLPSAGHTPPLPVAAPRVVRVGGVAGGVGTSTVALALAGLVAWSGHRTVAVGDDDLTTLAGIGPWKGPGVIDLAALDPLEVSTELATVARRVPAVAGLVVVGGGRIPVEWTAEGWPVTVVVADAGVMPPAADLLVARPDAGLLRFGVPTRPLVVNGRGPLSRAAVRRVVGRAAAAWLVDSPRVARAGVAGRVPAGLPGSWLATLRRVLAALAEGTR